MTEKLIIEGKSNYGVPRQNFADRLCEMTDVQFCNYAKECIWLSAYANNNPRSDYHWHADACYDEAQRRGKPELYQTAFDRAKASAS